jgi:acetolactate synthase-1/2/3 large subunit
MTNILTAMGQAYADSVPMLVISAVNRTEHLGMGEGRLHELPSQRALVAGVSAFSHTLLKPEQLPDVLARAFALFAAARPRPVHIEIPIDVIAQEVEPRIAVRPRPHRPAPVPSDVAAAAALLRSAQAPLLVLGGGAADAATPARILAEGLDAPVVNTVNAKGILPPGHPLHAGENIAFPPIHRAIAEADVVLAVGTEFGETEMYPEPRAVEIGGKLIRIDIDPEQVARGPVAELPIVADAGAALAAINVALGLGAAAVRDDTAGARRATGIRQATAQCWWPAVTLHRRLAGLVIEVLPDAILVGDSAEPVYALNQFFEAPRPRSYFNSSTGYGTLGYGLPAGIGAKLAAPDRPVVVLIGDGGLQFTIGELASAVEAAVPLIVLLWNNDGYGEIKSYMVEKKIAPIGVDIFTPDFVTIARGFDCAAIGAENGAALTAALREAQAHRGPTVIELRAGEFR